VPDGFIERPQDDRSMFLATLEAMNSGDRDRILIYVRPAEIVTGDKAKEFYRDRGQEPRDTAVVPRQDAQTQELVLQQDAAFWGVFILGDHENNQRRRFNRDEFVDRANLVLSRNEHPPIWIKRALSATTGEVIYLAEHQVG
jgi:hypothetical protein